MLLFSVVQGFGTARRRPTEPLALRTQSRTPAVEVLRMTSVIATSARANLYLAASGLKGKAQELLDVIAADPFAIMPL